MLFDLCRILFPAVIIEPTYLIRPNGGQHQRSVCGFSFDRATLDVKGLDDSLTKQFDGFLALFIQIIFPRPILFGKLQRSQPAAARRLLLRDKICFPETAVAEHDGSH